MEHLKVCNMLALILVHLTFVGVEVGLALSIYCGRRYWGSEKLGTYQVKQLGNGWANMEFWALLLAGIPPLWIRNHSAVTKCFFFFLYNFALRPWEASNLGLSPYRAAFYFTYLLIYFLAKGFVSRFLGMQLMPWWDSCMLVLTVSEFLVSHDMTCPQVSPSLPRGPRPGFLPPQSTVAAVAVPWCPVTSSEGRGQLSGCNFIPWWKVRGSEGGSIGCVNRYT